MAKQVQRRRGTAQQYTDSGFVGAKGEFTYDETAKTIRVHDGETEGGFKLLREPDTTITAGWAIKVKLTSQGLVEEIGTLQWSDLQTALTDKVIFVPEPGATGTTKCKITYTSDGIVINGEDLVDSDIPALPISKITGLQTALDGKMPQIAVVTGATSGTINLTDNAITKITPTSSVTLVPPTITDTSILHQLVVQLDNRAEVSVTLSSVTTTFGANTAVPGSTSLKGVFNIYYEYDAAISQWVVGVIKKTLAS